MWRLLAILGAMTALLLGAGPAFAFQETPVPPPQAANAAPEAKAPAMQHGDPAAQGAVDGAGKKVLGYSLPRKLDFGLELLYGQDQQQLEFQQGGPAFEENGDVSVLGKVKRRF